MKKIIVFVISLITIIGLSILGYNFYRDYQIKHAKKIVKLKDKEIEVYTDIKLKDLFKKLNGKVVKNFKIDTTKIGPQEINFEYINNDKIRIPYIVEIEIVDKTPPVISRMNSYSVTVNSLENDDLEKEFFCGDNYDDNPKCIIEGYYDLSTVGTYPIVFKGTDQSNNTSSQNITLYVKEKRKSSGSNNNSSEEAYTKYEDIITEYKTDNTKIGIDISHWQGTIDFKKVKESGVEFAYIRVGRGNGIGKEYVLDDRFEEYIKGFNKEKIPVGVYFYSNANSKKDAIKEAKWVLSKIKKYKVDLEIVFDWENWSSYQDYSLSFYHLTEMANAFIDTVEEKGYKGMIYASKHYLENIFFPIEKAVWLAHYTKKTTYEGNYKVWQICNDGKVSGINDNYVDIDIMYKS